MTMKMMSSTSTTSTSGVTFICGLTTLPSPLPRLIAMSRASPRAGGRRSLGHVLGLLGFCAGPVLLTHHQRDPWKAHLLRTGEDVAHLAVGELGIGSQHEAPERLRCVLRAQHLDRILETV